MVGKYACYWVSEYLFACESVYVCANELTHRDRHTLVIVLCMHAIKSSLGCCMCVRVRACINTCINVCMYVCMYIYIYIYAYLYRIFQTLDFFVPEKNRKKI
jgi:hypothetical protein